MSAADLEQTERTTTGSRFVSMHVTFSDYNLHRYSLSCKLKCVPAPNFHSHISCDSVRNQDFLFTCSTMWKFTNLSVNMAIWMQCIQHWQALYNCETAPLNLASPRPAITSFIWLTGHENVSCKNFLINCHVWSCHCISGYQTDPGYFMEHVAARLSLQG